MRIGEVARATGITKDTIRLYEKMGLIAEAERPHTYNNYKSYTKEHVEHIGMIVTMKQFGLSLKECKEIMEAIGSNSFDLKAQKKFITQKMQELDHKIARLTQLRQQLEAHLNYKCEHHNPQN